MAVSKAAAARRGDSSSPTGIKNYNGSVAKLADALVLGTSGETRGSSTLLRPISIKP